MTKLVIYRDNSAYAQFLAPAIAAREDLEVQVFPVGTDKADITVWIAKHADRVRSMEKVYMDRTCYEAGESLPSIHRPKGWIWMDVENNYGGFDGQFRAAAEKVLTKSSVDETIAAIISLMLKKEIPDQVFVISEHMGDHDLYGSLSVHHDWDRAAKEDAEMLRSCLVKVIGKPVTVVEYLSVNEPPLQNLENAVGWAFLDRHYPQPFPVELDSHRPNMRWLRLPIENLIADAMTFGIELDAKAYAEAIREIVAKW